MSKFSAEGYRGVHRTTPPSARPPSGHRRASETASAGGATEPYAPLNPRDYLSRQPLAGGATTSTTRKSTTRGPRSRSATGIYHGSRLDVAEKENAANSPFSAILDRMAKKLSEAETRLGEKDAKIKELCDELRKSHDAAEQVRQAKNRAVEALKEMEAQNTKLIRAYLDKKREAQESSQSASPSPPSTPDPQQETLIERLQEEIEDLKYANSRLHSKAYAANREYSANVASSRADGMGGGEGVPRGEQLRRMKETVVTAKTLKIITLEEDTRRLAEQNRSLREEQEAILRRTVQRDKADHYMHMGDIAFQHENWDQAIQHYSSAIATEDNEDFYVASLHAKRGACHFHVTKFTDSIYDTTLAIALDNSNTETYQRRAAAFAAIGAFTEALEDLEQIKRLGVNTEELQHTEQRWCSKSRQNLPVNHYKVLGLQPSASSSDVRHAFRSHALKFHPDKATCPLRKAAAEVSFRLVSDAQRTLSDPNRRAQLDRSV
mmetsp:Transcript_4928/g.8931  ORF Transcript_4928/g.8931 Transcript_4928/m.8931 type:complete len:493 (-) Transcript_4928:137-1615(-)